MSLVHYFNLFYSSLVFFLADLLFSDDALLSDLADPFNMEDDVTFDLLGLPNNLSNMHPTQSEQVQQPIAATQQFILHQQPPQQQGIQPQPQHSPLLPSHPLSRTAQTPRTGVNINGVTTSGIPVLLQQGVVQPVDGSSLGFCQSQMLQGSQPSNSPSHLPIQIPQQIKPTQQHTVQAQQQQLKKQISPKPAPLKKQPAIQQKPVAPTSSQPGQIVLQSVGQLPNGDKVPQVQLHSVNEKEK